MLSGQSFEDGILKLVFSNEKFEFQLRFHRCLFVKVQLTINQCGSDTGLAPNMRQAIICTNYRPDRFTDAYVWVSRPWWVKFKHQCYIITFLCDHLFHKTAVWGDPIVKSHYIHNMHSIPLLCSANYELTLEWPRQPTRSHRPFKSCQLIMRIKWRTIDGLRKHDGNTCRSVASVGDMALSGTGSSRAKMGSYICI